MRNAELARFNRGMGVFISPAVSSLQERLRPDCAELSALGPPVTATPQDAVAASEPIVATGAGASHTTSSWG